MGPIGRETVIEKWILQPIQTKGLLAKCYRLLREKEKADFTEKITWEKEFHVYIDQQQWLNSY